MTEEQQQQVEQITKVPDLDANVEPTPSLKTTKEKDPKRVKAGKKLAEGNKKAREAYKREMERESGATNQSEVEKSSWLPELSFDRVLTMIGIGLAAWNIFGRTRNTFRFERPPETNYVSEQKDPSPVPRVPPPSPAPAPPSHVPSRPLIGMD